MGWEGGKEEIETWTAPELVGLGERQRDRGTGLEDKRRRGVGRGGARGRGIEDLGAATRRVFGVTHRRLKCPRCLPPLSRIREGEAVCALAVVFHAAFFPLGI